MNEWDFIRDIARQTKELEEFLENDLLDIMEVEGLNHFEDSFEKQGWDDSGVKDWKARKTVDKRGRDITRYRTNKRGKLGDLNSYGRKNDGRAILTGHSTGGNKLKNSLKARQISGGIEFSSDKPYAQRHNEGLNGMPKRQFMGASKALDKKIKRKIDKQLNQIFKKK
ncbi:phage morphogenesis protein [Lutibacter sp.]|uniref:phage morphogenesis protein n=1 Tax=Lutibacter sp. TaxID=1925666 RepID=UPI0035637F41